MLGTVEGGGGICWNEVLGLWILFVLISCMLSRCTVPAGELLGYCWSPLHHDHI